MEKYLINPNHKIAKINKDIYGHFSEHLGRCIYEGLYVGENSSIPNINGMRKDVIAALKEMGIPVLRWPGGCFADEYHWMDGIGPKEKRKKMINTHWGGVVEDNSFGTHEFFELCDQLGCDAYVNGNVGSGTVREMSEWVEYITFDGLSPMAQLRKENGREKPWTVKYFGIGNENWGCGGNFEPEFYANEVHRYNTFVRDYYGRPHIYRIACGPNSDDVRWTEGLMKSKRQFDGLSLHYYTVPHGWGGRGAAATFSEDMYYATVSTAFNIKSIIDRHLAVMDHYDRNKRIDLIVDEWGCWWDVEEGTNPGFLYQQNTMRDAVVAGLTLNIFNKHADRIKMANIAQLVNVLQSVALTDGEDMLLTPTYYVFKMYKEHQNATLLGSYITSDDFTCEGIKTPELIESASEDNNGVIHSTIVNLSLNKSKQIDCQVADREIESVSAEILCGKMDAHNTFEGKNNIKSRDFTSEINHKNDGFTVELPPCSVVKISIECNNAK